MRKLFSALAVVFVAGCAGGSVRDEADHWLRPPVDGGDSLAVETGKAAQDAGLLGPHGTEILAGLWGLQNLYLAGPKIRKRKAA